MVFVTGGISAAEYSFTPDDIENIMAGESWEDMLSSLPDEMRDELAGIEPSSDAAGTVEAVREKSRFSYWLGKVWEAVRSAVPDTVTSVVPLFSVVMFMAATKGSVSAVASPALEGAFFSLMRLTGAISVFGLADLAVNFTSAYLTRICGIMNLLTPIMEAVCIASGSVTEGSVMSASMMLFVTVIGNINTHLLAPLASVLFTLSAVSMVCSEAKLGGLVGGVRKLIMRIWQISSMFFSLMLGAQSIIAQSADSLGTRSLKFAISSFVPMAGGMIVEAFGTLRSGLSFVRGASGIGGIIIIILLLISGIVPIFLIKLSVSLAASVSNMIGLVEMTGMLEEIRGIIELLEGIVLYTSIMFLLALILFTKSQAV